MRFFETTSVLLASASSAMGALVRVNDFGSNPTNLQMYISVPSKVAASPAIIVGLHPCGGNAQGWYSQSLAQKSETGGYILIYAGTTRFSNCWDVNAAASLTHGGGGDAGGIVSMINYAVEKYNGDKSKIFVYGGSSGAMMTNVMVGSYPDVFAAGAAYSGTAFACFAGSQSDPTPFGANQTCAQGLQHTPQDWAKFVTNAYPGYTGKRPRFLMAHGLADTLVRPQCGYEQLKQWSAVLGVTNTANQTGASVDAGSQYTKLVYGNDNQLVGYMGQGVGHIAPVNEAVMLKFFGLE